MQLHEVTPYQFAHSSAAWRSVLGQPTFDCVTSEETFIANEGIRSVLSLSPMRTGVHVI